MAASEFSARSTSAAIGAAIAFMLSVSSFINPIFGVFMVPLTHEFGWGRAEISVTHTFYSWTMAFLFLFTGRLMDRFGVRAMILPGIVLLAIVVASMSQQNGSIFLLYGQYMLIGVCGALSGLVPVAKVISGWFHDRRGILLSVMAVSGLASSAIVPQLANYMIGHFGWRESYMGLGLIILVVGLPTVGLLFREAPAVIEARQSPQHAESHAQFGMTAAEARKRWEFWICIVATALIIVTNSAMIAHTVPLLTDRGVTREAAVTVMTLIAVGGACGHLITGYLLDRVQSPRLAIPFAVTALCGVLLLHEGSGTTAFFIGGALMGAGITADYAVIPYFLTRFFGIRAFAEIYGFLWSIAAVVSGLGPPLMGYVYDKTGSYQWGLFAVEINLLLLIVCILLLPRYRFAARLPAFQHGEAEAIPGGETALQSAGNAD